MSRTLWNPSPFYVTPTMSTRARSASPEAYEDRQDIPLPWFKTRDPGSARFGTSRMAAPNPSRACGGGNPAHCGKDGNRPGSGRESREQTARVYGSFFNRGADLRHTIAGFAYPND